MGWVEAVYEKPLTATDIDGHPVEHDWYAPLPKPPERYLRNIPYEREAVEEAERVVRSRR